jgi:8-oxo-dGTP diphosphatase
MPGEPTFCPAGTSRPAKPPSPAKLGEELGAPATVTGFVGVVEHAYTEDDTDHHELNFLFEVDLDSAEPASQEDHLEFSWLTLDALADTDLRPGPLKTALQSWSDNPVPFWQPLNVR